MDIIDYEKIKESIDLVKKTKPDEITVQDYSDYIQVVFKYLK